MQKCRNCSRVCVPFVHNCCTQHSTELFWLPFFRYSRQAPELRCRLLEGRETRINKWIRVHYHLGACTGQVLNGNGTLQVTKINIEPTA